MKWTVVRKRIWRGLVTVLMMLVLLVSIGVVYQTNVSTQDRETYYGTGMINSGKWTRDAPVLRW